MSKTVFDASQYTESDIRSMPVLLLLDTSGSMRCVINPEEARPTGRTVFVDGKERECVDGGIRRIDVLEEATRKMLPTFAQYERGDVQFVIGIITFGADTRLVCPLAPASKIQLPKFKAAGETPLGEALRIAKEIIEDRQQIPSRAYRPAVILASDGEPTDDWQKAFRDFIYEGRSAKCDRMALAISKEADRAMLCSFLEGTKHIAPFEADDAEQIFEFFKFVTMTTVQRALSPDPNKIPLEKDVKQPAPAPSRRRQSCNIDEIIQGTTTRPTTIDKKVKEPRTWLGDGGRYW